MLFMKRMTEVVNVGAGIREEMEESGDEFPDLTDPNSIAKRDVPHGVEVYEINGPFFFGVADRIKDTLRGWRVGVPSEIDEKPVQVVQGTGAGGALATFYFDSTSGLLVRLVRYANSKVGRLPTQIDYADYRDVSGIKIPYKFKITWLDGLEDVQLTDVQLNVPVDAAKFATPAPAAR